jgi:hypothetical protein
VYFNEYVLKLVRGAWGNCSHFVFKFRKNVEANPLEFVWAEDSKQVRVLTVTRFFQGNNVNNDALLN